MKRLTQAPSRTEQVYASLRDSICDCTLPPGAHLVQEEIAETLGVSRQPVQQAMLLLKNDGLVVELGGRGLYVAPLEPDAIRRHYEIRVALDQLAARLAARQAAGSEAFATRLREQGERIIAQGESALRKGRAVEAVREDIRFHAFIYEASGNPLIASTAQPHWNFLRRAMVGVLLHANRGPQVWREHRRILDALVSGDEEAVARGLAAHALGAEEALMAEIAAGRASALVGTERATRAR